MLLYIDDSVVETLKSGGLTFHSDIIRNINDIALSFYNGKHLISGELQTFEYLAQSELLDKIPKHIFQFLLDKYSYYDFDSIVDQKLIVYANHPAIELNDNYSICINSYIDFDKSVLISENLNDCEFYVKLARKIKEEKSRYSKDLNLIDLELKQIHCGGSLAYDTTKNELDHNKFVLLIMDSDKKYKEDNFGSSCNEAKRIYDEFSKLQNKVINLEIINCREKENLIPPSCLLLCKNLNGMEIFLTCLSNFERNSEHEEFLRYLDIKDGVKVKEYSMHKERFAASYDLINSKGLLANVENCTKKEFDEEKVTHGIGGKFLNSFCADVLDNGIEHDIINAQDHSAPESAINKLLEKQRRSADLLLHIPPYIEGDWIKIYTIVLRFGCSFSVEERKNIIF